MSEISYKPLIRDMVWSYSKLETFESCRYRWYLKYIKKRKDEDRFYASYGTFMHKILERFYRGDLKREEMLPEYLMNFKNEVKGTRPKECTLKSYIEKGADYLRTFEPLPYETVAVERKVDFNVDGIPFTGVIDFIGRDEEGLGIVDIKSASLKPFSGREKPTKNDLKLMRVLRQLYIYVIAVEQIYGELPTKLCINSIKSTQLLIFAVSNDQLSQTKQWVKDLVYQIENCDDFYPTQDVFGCYWICGINSYCEYDIAERKEKRWQRKHENR